jgi:hypothetical protein
VSGYACRLSFADFDGGGGEVNEPLDEKSFGGRSTQGVPEALPHFMSLPVEARVEEVEGVEPLGVGGKECGKGTAARMRLGLQGSEHRGRDRRLMAKIPDGIEVAGRVVHRVR